MAKEKGCIPANDGPEEPIITLKSFEFPFITTAEVEIFDTLISNIDLLTANDNTPPHVKEKK